MPDKPIPEQDPITSKSYAAHYLIATMILIVTLFWALWDEAWGQRPWKGFQDQFKTRYSALLNTFALQIGDVPERCRTGSRLREVQAGLPEGLRQFQRAIGRCSQEVR